VDNAQTLGRKKQVTDKIQRQGHGIVWIYLCGFLGLSWGHPLLCAQIFYHKMHPEARKEKYGKNPGAKRGFLFHTNPTN